jgi:alpha-methylacyl-CoA racemase
MSGALAGLRIIEIAGIGPAPFAAMMLADHGAEVIRIDRVGAAPDRSLLSRTRTRIELDLKDEEGRKALRAMCCDADGVIEGFRPGVMERLGLGPDALLKDNPRLVYGRMTGWGQEGPLAQRAGHDINYIALAGNLHGYGRAGGPPVPPANVVGDFGGGGMLLAFGMMAALWHAQRTGAGQVVDCAMIDGAALLATLTWSYWGLGQWQDERGVNLLDTGAPFYDVYETSDAAHVAIGPIEPQFYATLCRALGVDGEEPFSDQHDRRRWPAQRERLATIFAGKPRDHWNALLEGIDACYAPVLSLTDAPQHAHNVARGAFIEIAGRLQPAPAPRFSATPAPPPRPPAEPLCTEPLKRRPDA